MQSTFIWLIVAGIIFGNLGLLLDMPVLAAIGNAMFIAGYFTPTIFTKDLKTKDAIWGGLWTFTVLHLSSTGAIEPLWLLSAIPLLIFSTVISKLYGSSFAVTQK